MEIQKNYLISLYFCLHTCVFRAYSIVVEQAQCASTPFFPVTALQYYIILEICKCDYILPNSLITCGYQLCLFWVSICLFRNHHRGTMSQWDNSQPGIQHSRCGLVPATNSESLSSALFYLYWWNMPWEFL